MSWVARLTALMASILGTGPGDPGYGARFSSYAVPVIFHAILDAVGKERPGEPLNGWADHEARALFDERRQQEKDAEAREQAKGRVSFFRARVRELLGVLTDREAEVVSLRLGLDGEV